MALLVWLVSHVTLRFGSCDLITESCEVGDGTTGVVGKSCDIKTWIM